MTKLKPLILFLSLILAAAISHGQTFGMADSNPRELYKKLGKTEKKLMEECAQIMGVPIDSLVGTDDVENTPEFKDAYIKVVVRSNYPFINAVTKEETTTAVEVREGKIHLPQRRFMVFIMKNKEDVKVTLQMYY